LVDLAAAKTLKPMASTGIVARAAAATTNQKSLVTPTNQTLIADIKSSQQQ
jgi:hypothetical protein